MNSGGFGYLRALHGAAALPGAAQVLDWDHEHRLVFSEDLRPPSSDVRSVLELAQSDARLLEQWIRSWPALCRGPEDSRFQSFCSALAAADPVAAARGRPGALPSMALAGLFGNELVRKEHSVLWSGDLNPSNTLCRMVSERPEAPERAAGAEASPGVVPEVRESSVVWRQIDLEGAGYCDPALLVAEAELGLPSALQQDQLHRCLEEQSFGMEQFRDLAEELCQVWGVTRTRRSAGRGGLQTILRSLRGTHLDQQL